MTRIQEVVGGRIREARIEKGWSQVELGRELEPYVGQTWSSQVMAQAEAGDRAFTAAEVVALALVLEKEIGWFFRPAQAVESVELPRRRRLPRVQGGGFEELPPYVVSWIDLVDIASVSGMAEDEVERTRRELERAMEALNQSLEKQRKARTVEPPASLSPEEGEILREISFGRTNEEIAKARGVSPEDVKASVARVFEKLGPAPVQENVPEPVDEGSR
jgi:DNA-binding CsgD family transcriptional regulator